MSWILRLYFKILTTKDRNGYKSQAVFIVFIDKIKYSKVSITSQSLYSVLTKSPKFLPPGVPRALQDIFLIYIFSSKVTVDELCKRWKTSVEHGLTDAQACK